MMNRKKLISWLSGIVIILLIVSCTPIETPPDVDQYASIVTEYDWMENVDLRDSVKSLFNYVKSSFSDVGMQAWFYDDANRIPSYDQYNPYSDYTYFPDDNRLLRDYARDHDSDSLFWHLLSVDRFEPNQGGGAIAYGRATDLNNGPNIPPSPANERFSMVFMQDIIDLYVTYNDVENIPDAFVTTVVHELGHQRAGLTDADEYPQYHDLSFDCVMDPGAPITMYPKFCKEVDIDFGQESSCLQNLDANYNVN